MEGSCMIAIPIDGDVRLMPDHSLAGIAMRCSDARAAMPVLCLRKAGVLS